jgi:hypothetical protein
MCSNYRPVTRVDRLLTFFGVERDQKTPPPEVTDVWPLGLAPFIRLHEDDCIVPAEAIFEPCWETGKAVRWRVSKPGEVPMGIAGIYCQWTDENGRTRGTFAMLTVNADGHPVMKRMHRPGARSARW